MTVEPRVYEGPFEREAWPDKLPAHVVDPRGERRIHGYAVRGDLARHYGVADLAWLALRGELPGATERDALAVAAAYLAPIHVGEAPAHAALVARVISARPSAIVAVAATGLSEHGRSERESLVPLLRWLDERGPDGPPAVAVDAAPSPEAIDDHTWLVERTVAWFGVERALPSHPVLTRVASAHALLHLLGFADPVAVEAFAVWARLLVVVAESGSLRGGAVRQYPARLPDYQYVDDEGSSR